MNERPYNSERQVRAAITIRDVAKEAKVSIGTASRVLNGHKSVSEEVRKRVVKAVKKLAYQPDKLAQSMRSGVTHTVACVTRDIGIAGFGVVVNAAESMLRDAGYTLLLGITDERKDREIDLLHILSQRRVDALIIASSREDDHELNSRLTNMKIPVVLLDRDLPDGFNSVTIDHAHGVMEATRYLLDFGHRRIALITGHPMLRPSRERVRPFRKLLKACKDAEPIIRTGGFSAEFGYKEALKLLERSDPPTAIIAGGMSMLAGVLQAIREKGLSIPKDVSIVAGADTELAALSVPPITAVRWNGREQGRAAVDLLLHRLKGPPDSPVQRVQIPTELVVRESVGPPPAMAK